MFTRSRRVVESGVDSTLLATADSCSSEASVPTEISVNIASSESSFEEPVVTTVVNTSSCDLLPNGFDLLRPGSPNDNAPDTPTITRIIVSTI